MRPNQAIQVRARDLLLHKSDQPNLFKAFLIPLTITMAHRARQAGEQVMSFNRDLLSLYLVYDMIT